MNSEQRLHDTAMQLTEGLYSRRGDDAVVLASPILAMMTNSMGFSIEELQALKEELCIAIDAAIQFKEEE
jgi:hypothetical protein